MASTEVLTSHCHPTISVLLLEQTAELGWISDVGTYLLLLYLKCNVFMSGMWYHEITTLYSKVFNSLITFTFITAYYADTLEIVNDNLMKQ